MNKINAIMKAYKNAKIATRKESPYIFCPHCKKRMIKMAIQDADEGDWIVGWKCGCMYNDNQSPDQNEKDQQIKLVIQSGIITDKEEGISTIFLN